MLRKLLAVTGVSSLLVALPLSGASAADMGMPYKAPPPPVSWTGFYLGAGWGYGMWDADTTPVNDATGASLTSEVNNAGKGWLAKFTAGYDYQLNSNIVAGIFANYDPADLKGTTNTGASTSFFNPLGGTEKESWDWDVGGRVGWLLTPAILTYVDGGYTQAHFDAISVNNLTTGAATGQLAARDYDGWFFGSGFVTPLPFLHIPGLFLDTEYRYSSYGSVTRPIIAPGGGVAVIGGTATDISMRPTVQTITTSLVWKFNWTGQ